MLDIEYLLQELVATPALLNDSSWRGDMATALQQIRFGSSQLQALTTPPGAEQIHGQLLLIAVQSLEYAANMEAAVVQNSGAQVAAAYGVQGAIFGYIDDLQSQLASFCS